MSVTVTRSAARLRPDPRRVVARSFLPGEWASMRGPSRLQVVLDRVLALPEDAVPGLVTGVVDQFGDRHRELERVLQHRAETVLRLAGYPGDLSPERCLLVGAYFTTEYAFEAAALTNPSMVPHPDGAPGRFLLSLRAIGEGHVSSIAFRSGAIVDGEVAVDPPSPLAELGDRRPPLYDRALFRIKLGELGADAGIVDLVLDGLADHFTLLQLEARIGEAYKGEVSDAVLHETVHMVHWLASSNYVVSFSQRSDPSERVLFPSGPVESAGMEDARFVRFTDDAGQVTYYATYTAYDGFEILPQLIETPDFLTFRIATLNGQSAQNKGIALFPRKIDGCYMALARQDREQIFLMASDNVRFWNDHHPVYRPQHAWELVQTGNCGSPIETAEGWLVLTHGVGPIRRYALGVLLLDRDDPTRVLAALPEPLLEPEPDERDGYVPNVVYSCGGMVHDGMLVVPYGFADVGAGFAFYDLSALLSALVEAPRSTSSYTAR